ncbi:hypothetical protein CABS01_05827 [Colletotrichum abscissum]|uniref:uncharacterized protein n=1 Tax=Colletotrichum abscissum TaxID=1671311 RepID=UPI0027D751D7|nr:uncharacterized protein CABS01_05827 [Colletotrichum abscissum]KAK1518293.1 hypothetical protein CABS01_05827 [Colletotrichum abscissum]
MLADPIALASRFSAEMLAQRRGSLCLMRSRDPNLQAAIRRPALPVTVVSFI